MTLQTKADGTNFIPIPLPRIGQASPRTVRAKATSARQLKQLGLQELEHCKAKKEADLNGCYKRKETNPQRLLERETLKMEVRRLDRRIAGRLRVLPVEWAIQPDASIARDSYSTPEFSKVEEGIDQELRKERLGRIREVIESGAGVKWEFKVKENGSKLELDGLVLKVLKEEYHIAELATKAEVREVWRIGTEARLSALLGYLLGSLELGTSAKTSY